VGLINQLKEKLGQAPFFTLFLVIHISQKVGLMNQAPTEYKPHPYKQIKVGLMNQAPTKEKSLPYKNKSNQYKG